MDDLLSALGAAIERARQDRASIPVLPQHYRDDGGWCRFSGCSSRSGACPAGCEAAAYDYSTDDKDS